MGRRVATVPTAWTGSVNVLLVGNDELLTTNERVPAVCRTMLGIVRELSRATPFAFVISCAVTSDWDGDRMSTSTVAFGTTLPLASVSLTAGVVEGSAPPTSVTRPGALVSGASVAGSTKTMAAGAAALAIAGIATLNPSAVATKLCGPAVVPRVSVDDAMPFASVTTLVGFTLPPVGAANTTVTPATPVLSAARTWTTAGLGR